MTVKTISSFKHSGDELKCPFHCAVWTLTTVFARKYIPSHATFSPFRPPPGETQETRPLRPNARRRAGPARGCWANI